MKQLTFLILISFTASFCRGQKEHLEPAEDFAMYKGGLKEYYANLFPLLYKGFSDSPYARYTSVPSFSREYAFSVEQKNGGYFVLSNSLSKSYWYAKDKHKVRSTTITTEIDKELFNTIGDLFRLLAEQTRKPEKNMGGLDGTTYYFATVANGGKLITGKTWSPDDNTLLAHLVKICDKLFSLDKIDEIRQGQVQAEITQLIADLQK